MFTFTGITAFEVILNSNKRISGLIKNNKNSFSTCRHITHHHTVRSLFVVIIFYYYSIFVKETTHVQARGEHGRILKARVKTATSLKGVSTY